MFQAMLWAQPPPRYVRPMPTDPTKPRTLNRPEPILSHSAQPVDQDHSPDQAAQRLRDGEVLIVTDHFSTGAEILSRLHTLLGPHAAHTLGPYAYRVRDDGAFPDPE